MVTLQIINKVLQTGNIDIIKDNGLDEKYFTGYEPEFNFIVDHYDKYNKTPDKETFISAFNEFTFIEVQESDNYLLDTLFEEHLYYKSVTVITEVASLLKTNAVEAVSYLQSQLPDLQPIFTASGIDIISKSDERLKLHLEKKTSETPWYITTGFPELDTIINGWAKGEELVVLFARTGQGKSWVLTKTLSHAWRLGYRVGYISPEMSPNKIGYRLDTLLEHFSNNNLVWGKEESEYESYIAKLKKSKNPFVVATPQDFQKKITVSKLKQFCLANKLDILGIDGITYLTDERYKRGDNKSIMLTNISEDLLQLSNELGIPVIVVVQSNRGGAISKDDEGTPELEHIKDSDGIAQNATKVLSIRQTGAGLEIGTKKHRDGKGSGKVVYYWDIDKGEFEYIPASDDTVKPQHKQERIESVKKSYKDNEDVF